MSIARDFIDGLRHLVTWWVIVAPWEQVIRVRWGKHVKLLGAGTHLRVPFADRIYRQTTRLRTADLRWQTVTTADGHTVTCAGMIKYGIHDLHLLYETLHHAEETILDLVAGAVARTIYATKRDDLRPDAIRDAVREEIDLSIYGLGNFDLQLTDFAFVKTYRFIKDERWGTAADSLDTQRPEVAAISG